MSEGEREKIKRGGAEFETDPDWLKIKSQPHMFGTFFIQGDLKPQVCVELLHKNSQRKSNMEFINYTFLIYRAIIQAMK